MKTELKTYIVIEYNDLDNAITEEYGFGRGKYGGFESVPAEEWDNDSNYIINIDGDNDDWNQRLIDERRASFGSVRAYLNDMAKRGLIAKGEYLIRVSW